MSAISQSVSTLPIVELYLDVDGVLVLDTTKNKGKIFEKYKAINIAELDDISLSRLEYSTKFDKVAVSHLMYIIENIKKIAEVHLVISSSWRIGKDLSELKDVVFYEQPFAPYIVDKIHDKVTERCEEKGNAISIGSKPRLIEYRINRVQNVAAFLVLDNMESNDPRDPNGKMSLLFKDSFLKINSKELLTKENAEQAIDIITQKLKSAGLTET